ncbi:hypothetical protein [Micromonospora sp. L32]|uniref:hypothetical protein n=1 Tax=Micromonospora TaxID=1873 RepID=UPI003F88FEDC
MAELPAVQVTPSAQAGAEQATRAVCVAASSVAASSATPPSAAVNPRLSRLA